VSWIWRVAPPSASLELIPVRSSPSPDREWVGISVSDTGMGTLDPRERGEREERGAVVFAKSNLSAPSAAYRLENAVHRAGSAAQAVGRAGTG
jgi:hypothetical protein